MIPRDYITQWREQAPWTSDARVEQDLVIHRALVMLFQKPEIAASLAFRGGTALHKLHLAPAARYSEDIDLVQRRPEPIGAMLDHVRSVLDPWLGPPRREQSEGCATLIYRFASEDVVPVKLRLKIEINTREHFSALGVIRMPVSMGSRWYAGSAEVATFTLEELLGTKLRSLYQRKKGRDLFDLWHGLGHGNADPRGIVACFGKYMEAQGRGVTRAQFEANLAGKVKDRFFRGDIHPLLRVGVDWDFDRAMSAIADRIVALFDGDPWRGGP